MLWGRCLQQGLAGASSFMLSPLLLSPSTCLAWSEPR